MNPAPNHQPLSSIIPCRRLPWHGWALFAVLLAGSGVHGAPITATNPIPHLVSPGAERTTRAYDLLNAPVAYSVPTMEDIILASQFAVPSTEYLDKSRSLLGEVILSLDVLNADGEFRVVLHKADRQHPNEVGEEVAEIFRGTPHSLALESGNQRQVRFDQKRGLHLPEAEYFVVLHGLSGVPAVAWNVTEKVRTAAATPDDNNSQVIWNPEVHRRLMRRGQLATAMLPDDNPDAAGPIGGLPLALSAGGAFMMQVSITQVGAGSIPEPGTTALVAGLLILVAVLYRHLPMQRLRQT
jgi:hypothetical protein